jgi:hypothetical protein
MSRRPTCPTCPRPRQSDHLMCGICWAKVPREIQHRVWATARAMWGDRKSQKAREAWLAARQDAINAVADTHLVKGYSGPVRRGRP